MAAEIELKAHVKDYSVLRILLTEKAELIGAFEKEDRYYINNAASLRLRVRREKRVFSDGTERFYNFLTHKSKEVRDGIEVNEEREFEIKPVSPSNYDDFEYILASLGFKKDFSKKKKGWAYLKDGINVDLCEVEGLGWFLELELLTGRKSEETLEPAGKKLLALLDELGIPQEEIESRFYSQMLFD